MTAGPWGAAMSGDDQSSEKPCLMPAIYLDHNATTPPHPEVIELVAKVSREAFANPGSRHSGGRIARRVLEQARDAVATILGARSQEVLFTSGGTEANNLAVLGATRGRRGRFAVLDGEHPSLEEPLNQLEAEGWIRRRLPMDSFGRPLPETADELARDAADLGLVVLQLAHNETGVLRDLSPWANLCSALTIPLHVDAVQAAGRMELNFGASGASTMSIAAHKFRGPRGMGALLVRAGVKLRPLMTGGHQESDLRPGTECPALAAGMARALELWVRERDELSSRLSRFRDRFEALLIAAIPEAVVHAAGVPRLPNTSNVAFPGVDGDALLVALDLAGVQASLGSACASGSSEPAPILMAMGCTREIARSSLRFSLGWTTTDSEIEDAVQRIARAVAACRQRSQ